MQTINIITCKVNYTIKCFDCKFILHEFRLNGKPSMMYFMKFMLAIVDYYFYYCVIIIIGIIVFIIICHL